jgi:type IV secretion system protein VirB9
MQARILCTAAPWLAGFLMYSTAHGQAGDPRLKDVWYDPRAVITVAVKRGVVTHIVLDRQESITEIGTGLGADCGNPDASWCIAAQPGGHHIFIKPKSSAGPTNNLAVVTDKRTYSLRLVVIPVGDARDPVYRLIVRTAAASRVAMPVLIEPPKVSEAEIVTERMKTTPEVVNSQYSIAEGAASDDIVPTLVFDDGRFTYFRFPNNREIPAVFHVLGDGSETLVNTRMEGELLVTDRVSRRLMLRAGSAVVSVWNDAFDIDGMPPQDGTTVDGVQRTLRNPSSLPPIRHAAGGKP